MKVFLFPGQGSQEIGMGLDLFREDDFFNSLIEYANSISNTDLKKLCLKGPEREFIKPQYLQPLLTCVCLGYYKRTLDAGIYPDVILGHSLGEITSLGASGIVSYEQAILISAKRGQLMYNVASKVDGGLMAVLFVPIEKVKEILVNINMDNRIVIASENALDQIIISGENSALEEFSKVICENQIGKTKRIPVMGPWHSPYMNEAMLEFKDWIKNINFNPPSIPMIFNGTGEYEKDPQKIKQLITQQLVNPVLWRKCMQKLLNECADIFFEIGPQRILSGLIRINGFPKTTKIYNISNILSIKRAIEELKK
jgi:[acyl-carrier-protein] S-malonyltransferase